MGLEDRIHRLGHSVRDVFIVLMRAYFGVSFVLYGISKLNGLAGTTASFAGLGIPLPFIAVPLVGGLEVLFGACLALGFHSQLSAAVLSCILVGAYATAHRQSVLMLFTKPSLFVHEEPFSFLVTCLIVMCFGTGRISLDFLYGGVAKHSKVE